ncbi:hypothetical protein L208DRAFT_1015832, partial [Tricholoma matsutake]
AKAKKTWCSWIYSFFIPDVIIQKEDGHISHFFACAVNKCKSKVHGVQHFQDKRDRSSTANLKQHATCCFGEEAVNSAFKGEKFTPSGNIFTTSAHQGQCPVTYSHCTHTNPEMCAHIAKWVAENNRPANIVSDPKLIKLLTMGHPNIKVPSPNTVQHDIKAAYTKCCEHIKLLQ